MTCEFTLGRSLWIVATAAWLAVPAWGQDTYPSKAITVVVPFPPGGVADIVARPAADAEVAYGRPLKPHGWQPWTNAELMRIVARHIERHRPRH